jgi:hypothetical protein
MRMMKFIKFLLIWISQQLAIPFWMVGHIHLSLSTATYSDVKILLASLGMNVVVAVGFWLDWRLWRVDKVDHIHILTKQINENRKSISGVAQTTNRIVEEINQMKVYK